jgi:hypothetical protein
MRIGLSRNARRAAFLLPRLFCGIELQHYLTAIGQTMARQWSEVYITCRLFQFAAPDPASTRPLRPFDKGYTHFCVDVTDIERDRNTTDDSPLWFYVGEAARQDRVNRLEETTSVWWPLCSCREVQP